MKRSLFFFMLAALVMATALPAAASLAGKWAITVLTPMGERRNDMTIAQDGDKLTVTIASPRGEQVYQGAVQGLDVSWSGTRRTPGGMELTVRYQGNLEDGAMKGTVQMGGRGESPWSAVRVK